MTNSRTLLITTFNEMAFQWVIAHPVLGKRVHPVKGFITMDEYEHITVWIGYFDEAYCEKHIKPDIYAYTSQFITVLEPLVAAVCVKCEIRRKTFPINFLGYRDNIMKFISYGV